MYKENSSRLVDINRDYFVYRSLAGTLTEKGIVKQQKVAEKGSKGQGPTFVNPALVEVIIIIIIVIVTMF